MYLKMTWHFIRKHWFTLAMALIILLAIIRHFGFFTPTPSRAVKFTDDGPPASGNPSYLGVLPAPSKGGLSMPEVDESTAAAFFRRFAEVAVSERKKYGVPASVTLSYAYVNSFAGRRDLCGTANSYFALPCTPDWEGARMELNGHCYRRYETAWESFRDFSVFMSSRPWYGQVRAQSGKDWKGWVQALEAHGTSEVAQAGEEMAKVIVKYQLEALDR